MEKIALINQVIQAYFKGNPSLKVIPAKDLMPQFIKAGIFVKDQKNGKPIREVLRDLDRKNHLNAIPFTVAERKLKTTNWFFRPQGSVGIKNPPQLRAKKPKDTIAVASKVKKDSDENYVLNLCDEVLNQKGLRQHRFEFLFGDSGTKLPVDIYYPSLNLVIEYRETQHTNSVKHFDKLDVMTVSGVHRGEQRKIYDQRRRDVLPNHGIKLIEIGYSDFKYDRNMRIVRDSQTDKKIIATLFNK